MGDWRFNRDPAARTPAREATRDDELCRSFWDRPRYPKNRIGTLSSDDASPRLLVTLFPTAPKCLAKPQIGSSRCRAKVAVKSLVALRHVDPPTPWGTGPEHESLAHEVLDQLEAATLITPDEAKYLRGSLTRDEAAKAKLSPDPAIIRGFDRTADSDERTPALVIDAMRQTQRGVRPFGTVLRESAEGKKTFRAVDAAGIDLVGEDPKQAVTLSDPYLRAEYPDPDKVPAPRSSGDQPREIYNQRVHDLQTVIERLDVAREQVKGCREHDGTVLAEKYGVDCRACRKWLEVIHQVAKDLAIREQNDIKSHGRRHDDESDDAPNPDLTDDVDSDEQEGTSDDQ